MATTTRTTWHHATTLGDEGALEVSPRLGIKWFAAPHCTRHSAPSGGGGEARVLVVEIPAAESAPVIDVTDLAGSLAVIDHDLTDDQIEALQYDIDAMGYEADEAVAWLLDELTSGRGIVLRNWEGDGDEVLIVGARGLHDARIVGTLQSGDAKESLTYPLTPDRMSCILQ